MKVQKKQKLSQVERQLADKYIAEGDESEDSEDNLVDEFIENQFKDF